MNRASTVLAVSLLIPFISAPADPHPRGCGEPGAASDLGGHAAADGIVNGTPTNYDSWQGAIALMWTDYGLVCTGTLIDPEVVLSAGHCVLLPDYGMDFVSNPAQLWIAGGADVTTAPAHIANVESVVAHPDWDGYGWGTDLSMIKLSSPVVSVPRYGLRAPPQVPVGEPVKIVGYGMTDESDYESSGIHRMGDTTVLTVLEEEIELGGETNGCFGDSGGPMFSHQDGEWVVSGVTSHGESEDCWADHGAWYVNVVTYLGWIDETMWDMTGHGLGPDTDTDSDTDTESGSDSYSDTDPDTDTESAAEETDAGPDAVPPIERACYCGAPGAVAASSWRLVPSLRAML